MNQTWLVYSTLGKEVVSYPVILLWLSSPWHVQDRFDHPYISFLFYGRDAAGDFIPVKQLREKYNRPRHEIPLDETNGED